MPWGVHGVFQRLELELRMRVELSVLDAASAEVEVTDLEASARYMTVLRAELPELEYSQPIAITFADEKEEGLLEAKVEVIMQLGLMAVS